MSKKKPSKIKMPTDEELARFGGKRKSASAEEVPTATAQADQEPAPRAKLVGEQPAKGAPPTEVEELKDKLARARAELANVQRRSANERTEAVRFALVDFMRDLLPVIDDFERTLQAAEAAGDKDSIVKGTRLIYDNLLQLLKKHNVEPIEARGRAFDPALHEAMMQQPSADLPPGSVLEEVQRGYKLHDRVIRPTRVIVSAAPPDEEGSAESGADEDQAS